MQIFSLILKSLPDLPAHEIKPILHNASGSLEHCHTVGLSVPNHYVLHTLERSRASFLNTTNIRPLHLSLNRWREITIRIML